MLRQEITNQINNNKIVTKQQQQQPNTLNPCDGNCYCCVDTVVAFNVPFNLIISNICVRIFKWRRIQHYIAV